MSNDDRTTEPTLVPYYEIRIDGHLGARWATWFDGMTLTNEDDGTTVICGPVIDQAALHGVLQKLRDLGISLRSLTQLDPATETERPTAPHDHHHHHAPGATS